MESRRGERGEGRGGVEGRAVVMELTCSCILSHLVARDLAFTAVL